MLYANQFRRRAVTARKHTVPVSPKPQPKLVYQEVTTLLDINPLPDEILEEIFTLCPSRDLFQLSLVSRRLSSVSRRFLYRTIPNLIPSKFTAFLMSIYFFDRTAPLVRSFTLLPQKYWIPLDRPLSKKDIYECIKKIGSRKAFSARHVLQSRLTLLGAVLRKLRNLTSLRIYLGNEDTRKAATVDALLTGCTFQLLEFSFLLSIRSGVGVLFANSTLFKMPVGKLGFTFLETI
ncbi:hypothetical protein GALMADRAFT_252320 [Galerina marginata CBS 339.88]|uniref:F-box domain-containing protein n=1 Tax=Galerina marginata (strain CBS 339.88) TaxID=685588 RepID=A0A067T1U9_GALM3|nr:hypothetical protein GALMADRAFT_252320 [Galerina marginata CBS 339.88]